VAPGELAPERLHDLARGLTLGGGVREAHGHRTGRRGVGHDREVRLPVGEAVQVVGELGRDPHHHTVLRLHERVGVELALRVLVDRSGLHQVGVAIHDLLERVAALDDLVGDVADAAVAIREDAEVARPRPEGKKFCHVVGRRADLLDPLVEFVSSVEIYELGELPKRGGLGLPADDCSAASQRVEVEVGDSHYLHAVDATVLV